MEKQTIVTKGKAEQKRTWQAARLPARVWGDRQLQFRHTAGPSAIWEEPDALRGSMKEYLDYFFSALDRGRSLHYPEKQECFCSFLTRSGISSRQSAFWQG